MILALKTADATTQLWLIDPAQPTPIEPTLTWESGRTLADQLLGRITNTLAEVHASLSDLTSIIIFSGPGSFTSLRIGHSTANALADSLNIPVVGTQGDDWLAQGRDQLTKAPRGRLALPHYGSEAHITRPRA